MRNSEPTTTSAASMALTPCDLSAPNLEPICIRIAEAVRLTGISRSRLYELIGAGDIEVAKVGSSTLVIVASLRQFIDDHRRSAKQF